MDSKVALVAAAFVVFGFIVIYNRFIKKKNRLEEAWSGIDVQLKRRSNLIPNLVETVRGYMKHEQGVLREVTELRTGAAAGDSVTERSAEESRVSHVLQHLLAVAEKYPELRANTSFVELQRQLDEVEEQIQYARRYYNGAARDWNVLVESFPSNLVANLFRFVPADFFEIDRAVERAVPEVRF